MLNTGETDIFASVICDEADAANAYQGYLNR